MTRIVLAPPVLAFLPEYAGRTDPVASLRAVVLDAVSWLGTSVTVLGDAQAQRVGAHLLASTARSAAEPSYLVLGNGSARRTDVAPGPYDARAVPFDDDLRRWLLADGPRPDLSLSGELWAATEPLAELDALGPRGEPQVDYDDAPFGVQYWVVRFVGVPDESVAPRAAPSPTDLVG